MVSTATPAPEAPAPEPVSSVGRIFGVLFNPKATFQSIAARPTWVLPLVILTIISFGMDAFLAKRVDWQGFVRAQLDKTGRLERIPADQQNDAIARGAIGQKYGMYVRGIIGDSLVALIIGAVYLGAFNLGVGAELRFKTAFSIVVYTMIPMGIKELLATVVIGLKDPSSIDPINVLASNAGAFLSSDSPTWLLALGIAMDVFAFWGMALAIIGFSAANPKKIKTGTATAVVLCVFAFFLCLGVGLAAAFS